MQSKICEKLAPKSPPRTIFPQKYQTTEKETKRKSLDKSRLFVFLLTTTFLDTCCFTT
nr:MAG TPA: hypothetical protein [Caudoviricetes sp.]